MPDSIHAMHQNEREKHAKELGLSLSRFDMLVANANSAYELIKNYGPFYGNENIKEPTFRITAAPVVLPRAIELQLLQFGRDIMLLGNALKNIPQQYKEQLGSDLDYTVPFTCRIDAIFDGKEKVLINELEGVDGANALMIVEQLAYQLQALDSSTAAHMGKALQAICNKEQIRIALIKVNNPNITNAYRFVTFLQEVSKGKLQVDLFLEEDIQSEMRAADWSTYDGILNEASFSPSELLAMGIKREQLLFSGSYIGLINKGVFAHVFDKSLEGFWIKEMGEDALQRIQSLLIPSQFISSTQDIDRARAEGKVVKASWAKKDTSIINRGKGVAVPAGDVEQSSEERWNYVKELFTQGVKLISQDFVIPGKIHAYLRKKGATLEPVDWYNRICIKYVCDGNPNILPLPSIAITAAEATLGPSIIPAGRKCAFTAVAFEK